LGVIRGVCQPEAAIPMSLEQENRGEG